MSIIYACKYKEERNEQHFEKWRQEKSGRLALLPASHPHVLEQKKIFLKQVEALDLDIKHLLGQDPREAFNKWNQFGFGLDAYQHFRNKLHSYEDPDPKRKDYLAKQICEQYKDADDEDKDKYFDLWLGANQKLYIQALKGTKNQLALRDSLYEEFMKWTECPWLGGPYQFAIYLLTHPKGPSGYDNKNWADVMMKCFYAKPEKHVAFHSSNEAKMSNAASRLELAGLLRSLKPIPDMIRDLKNKESHESTPSTFALEDQIKPREQINMITADMTPKEKLEFFMKMAKNAQHELEQEEQQEKMKELQPEYENLAQKISKKRSFQKLTWDFKKLPDTKKAKVFKEEVQDNIQRVQKLEEKAAQAKKVADDARKEAANSIQNAVEALFK